MSTACTGPSVHSKLLNNFSVNAFARYKRTMRAKAFDAAVGRTAEFRFVGGISEFCGHLSAGEPVTDVLRITGSGMKPIVIQEGKHDVSE